MMTGTLIPVETIEQSIYMIRGYKVMIDSDLAKLYTVTTFNLNKAVKRNIERFPEDFMFQLTDEEWQILRFQIGISKSYNDDTKDRDARGGRRVNPYVFTQEGIAMLSSVLKSERAIKINIEIMRAFVRLRQMLAYHEEFRKRFENIEKRLGTHDEQFKVIIDAMRQLMEHPDLPKRQIGLSVGAEKENQREKK